MRAAIRVAAVIVAVLASTTTRANLVTRETVSTSGVPANADSFDATISDDGRWVAFESRATDLVPGDLNLSDDDFVRDRLLGTTSRVSVGPGGVEGSDVSILPYLSADGSAVAFTSLSGNLDPACPGFRTNAYVRDLGTGTTTCVGVTPSGTAADGDSFARGISADGRFVLFESFSTNIIFPVVTSGRGNVFVRDRLLGATTLVSVDGAGGQLAARSTPAAISATGRFVLFDTAAAVDPSDTNGRTDTYLRDTVAGTTIRVSVDTGGVEFVGQDHRGGGVSADGNVVAFYRVGPYPVGGPAFVRDIAADTTRTVDGGSGALSVRLTPDAKFAVFETVASLVPADGNTATDAYARDLATDALTLLTAGGDGKALGAVLHAVSPDLRWVAVGSGATGLVPGDLNESGDVFVIDRGVPGAVCGDGTVTPPEQCDDGNLVDGDGCEHDCSITLCSGGAALTRTKLTLVDLKPSGLPDSRQKLTLSTRLPLGPGALNPAATGIQVRVEDPNGPIADWSAQTIAIGPGLVGSACGRDGWQGGGSGPSSSYKNVSGALDPPYCTFSTANGLQSVRVVDRRVQTGGVDIVLRANKGRLPLQRLSHVPFPPAAMRLTVALAGGPGGPCGTSGFLTCVPNAKHTKVICR